MSRLIVVANRLPVTFSQGAYIPTTGGLASALLAVKREGVEFLWVGTLPAVPEAERAMHEAELLKIGCAPVWMDEGIYNEYYA